MHRGQIGVLEELQALKLVLVVPALDQVWGSRPFVEWRGRKLNVVSREGLIRMKRLSGRMQDLARL